MSEASTVGRHHKRRENYALQFWRSYRFELIGLAALALGAFLLLEQMNLRSSLARWFRQFAAQLLSRAQRLDDEVAALLDRISVSDLVGFALIAGAAVVIVLRIRWRVLNSPGLTTTVCPKCGGPIHRVHRKTVDRLISFFVPVRRYRCHDDACRWKGLRAGNHHHSTHSHATSPS